MTVPRRRFLRFSLRSLLLLALAASLGLGIAAKTRHQAAAAAALERTGCNVYGTVVEAKHSSAIADADLIHLRRLSEIQFLYLGGTQVTDAGMVNLHALEQLRGLHLNGTMVTDAGIAQLAQLKQLLYLNLDKTGVTDTGLASLRGLSSIRLLYLRETSVTDAGVRDLQRAARPDDLSLKRKVSLLAMNLPAQPRRRWFRFSLRTLLFLAVAIGTALGCTLHKVREQGRAVAALEKMGCKVVYSVPRYVVDLNVPYSRRKATMLERLRELCGEEPLDATDVAADDSQLNDQGMVHLRVLTKLEYLSLGRTPVSDQGLKQIRGLTELRRLFLNGTQITDAGLDELRGLSNLRDLYLQDTRVTEQRLIELGRQMPHVTIRY